MYFRNSFKHVFCLPQHCFHPSSNCILRTCVPHSESRCRKLLLKGTERTGISCSPFFRSVYANQTQTKENKATEARCPPWTPLTGCRHSRVIPDRGEQMLGLTPTPSGLRLGDVEKENRKKGYSTGYHPKGKLHTSPEENEKQVFSGLVGHCEAIGQGPSPWGM